MRKLPLLVACLLVAFAAAPAFAGAPGEGTLSVRDGRGMLQLSSRGTMIGRIERGRIEIIDPNPYDRVRAIVLGQEHTAYKNARRTIYSGRDIRVRVNRGLLHVRFEGRGIQLSAVGRGRGMIAGASSLEASVYDGVWSLNDEEYKSLPDVLTGFQLVAPPPPEG